jgi:hypothetical protein
MDIRKYLGTSILSAVLLLACGIPGLAKESRTVTLSNNVVVNGTSLPAGKYTVRWENNSSGATIEFVQHHKVVLSTNGGFEERSKSYNRNAAMNTASSLGAPTNAYDCDSVVYYTASDGTISLLEIHFAYSNKMLVFNQEKTERKTAN